MPTLAWARHPTPNPKIDTTLVRDSTRLQVLDMGLARFEQEVGPLASTAAATLTPTGQAMGTILVRVNEPGAKVWVDDDAFRERVLDGARDGVLATTSGRLLGEGPIVVGDVTGRRLEIAVERGAVTLTALVFLTERSMVQVLAFAEAGEASTARAGEFCQSFRFVPLRQ